MAVPARGVPVPTAAQVARVGHLRAAKDLLDREYASPLDLDTIAARAGYSRFHFVRAFRAAYGDPPGRYLTGRRVERAKDLLRGANLTVTEICHLVGFTSLGSFSVRFRELVGVSPSAYREAAVRAGGPPPIPGCFIMMRGGLGGPDGLRVQPAFTDPPATLTDPSAALSDPSAALSDPPATLGGPSATFTDPSAALGDPSAILK